MRTLALAFLGILFLAGAASACPYVSANAGKAQTFASDEGRAPSTPIPQRGG